MSEHKLFLLALGLGLAAGCDRSGKDLLPQPNEDYPGVIEIGRIGVVAKGDVPVISPDFCADPASGCFYGQISATDGVSQGGATFTFTGTGDNVCVMVDPESVSWNHEIGVTADAWAYPEDPSDDGDMDLFGGLSSYYTGSPGVEMGDFTGYYTDSLGRQIEIDYVECYNESVYTGGEAHSGRGAPEYCDMKDTIEGVEYTIVLETFSVPRDDGLLSFMVAVIGSRCSGIDTPLPTSVVSKDDGSAVELSGITECTVVGEQLNPDNTPADPCGEMVELAYCANQTEEGEGLLRQFCCANPSACGDDVPDDICEDFDRDAFCTASPGLCDCEGDGK